MSKFAILRTKKLKSFGEIAGSYKHTFRDINTPNADSSRTAKNKHLLAKSTEQGLARFRSKIPKKVRKNAVLAIEYLITASPDSFQSFEDWIGYFKDSVNWLKAKHGDENLVSYHLHVDEKTPHLVAYIVPIDQKGKLNCREFLGGRQKLSAMQTDFANMAMNHGLKRGLKGSRAKHQTIKQFYSRLTQANEIEAKELAKTPTLEEKPLTMTETIATFFGYLPARLKKLEELSQLTATMKLAADIAESRAHAAEITATTAVSAAATEYEDRRTELDNLAAELGDKEAQLRNEKRELNIELSELSKMKMNILYELEVAKTKKYELEADKTNENKIKELENQQRASERLIEALKIDLDDRDSQLAKYRHLEASRSNFKPF